MGKPNDLVQGTLDLLILKTIAPEPDRKSTRLNSSHGYISYAVFCLKKNTLIPGLHCLHYFSLASTPAHYPVSRRRYRLLAVSYHAAVVDASCAYRHPERA